MERKVKQDKHSPKWRTKMMTCLQTYKKNGWEFFNKRGGERKGKRSYGWNKFFMEKNLLEKLEFPEHVRMLWLK
jgi:hypothetical protein